MRGRVVKRAGGMCESGGSWHHLQSIRKGFQESFANLTIICLAKSFAVFVWLSYCSQNPSNFHRVSGTLWMDKVWDRWGCDQM